MPRIIGIVAAIGACLAWAIRKFANRLGSPVAASAPVGRPAQDGLWSSGERKTTAFRMRSGPGPMM